MLRPTLLVALITMLVGCDAASPDSELTVAFELGGALQAGFLDEVTEAGAAVQTTPNGARTLLIRLRADQERDGQERAELTVRLPLDGDLVPGRYALDGGARADLSYVLDRSPEFLAMYRFEGRSLVLDVAQVDEGSIVGEVSVVTEQTFGERTLYGQREVVDLAGPVTARASFSASFEVR